MKDDREKECPMFAVCFTAVLPASFSIGVDYVKQRLMKPVLDSIYWTRKIIHTEAETGGIDGLTAVQNPPAK